LRAESFAAPRSRIQTLYPAAARAYSPAITARIRMASAVLPSAVDKVRQRLTADVLEPADRCVAPRTLVPLQRTPVQSFAQTLQVAATSHHVHVVAGDLRLIGVNSPLFPSLP
jgi:hypothetical protein